MKTITFVAYNRADYTKQVLHTIEAAQPEGYEMFISLDPGDDATEQVVRDFLLTTKIKTVLVKNEERLGVNYNNLNAFKTAVEAGSDFNVAIEDDTPISPDAFQLADWFYNHGHEYLVLNFFTFGMVEQEPLSLMECNDFCPWAWCFSKKAFERYIHPGWMGDERGWDWSINKVMQAFNLKSLRPVLSRSGNIGRDLGTHCTPELFDNDFPTGLVMSTQKHGDDFKIIPKELAATLLDSQQGHRMLALLR